MMSYFLPIVLLSTVMTAMASEPEVVLPLDDQSAPLCAARPLDGEGFKTLYARGFCLQAVVVPHGQVAQAHFTNRQVYCRGLDGDEKELAQISNDFSSLGSICSSPSASIALPPGTHYIGVSASSHPLKVALTYIKTQIGCGDKLSNSLIGIPLTFVPTMNKCSLLLPGRSILKIKAVRRTEGTDDARSHQCLKLRMGKKMYNLNHRFEPVCEIPATSSILYRLGCGSVIMEASDRAVRSVDFIITPMDEEEAVIGAPLMCSENEETVEQIIQEFQ